ncbi:MAG TPA: hypothetical protein VL742_16020, partial [Casimicrobiaceae bacterium]|nr:hypothetical protein [Casimicrobiaceae bacterium]
DIRPGAIVRLRDPEGRLREGVVHHLNACHEPFILPSEALIEPFYAHPADIEEVLGFHPELVAPAVDTRRTRRRRASLRRHRLR